MNSNAIRHGWRTRVREVVAAVVTFAAGVVAATAGAGVVVRTVSGVLFLGGAYLLLDALVLASSWRLTATGLKIPTVASRKREISGRNDLIVAPVGRWIGGVAVSGERGTRVIRVNPLVSPVDLHGWFADIADDDGD